MNQQAFQPQFKPVYYLQRPHSPKNVMNHVQSAKNISLTMSIGPNNSVNNFLPAFRARPELAQTATIDPFTTNGA
jgi:hypothetical protein